MEEKTVMDALVQMKRTGNLLNELWDLTRQLGESIDRNDQVSTQMLIAMREEPLGKLQDADQALRDQLELLPDHEAAAALAAMLNGGPPADPAQRPQVMLCEQVGSNNRRLKQIIELDRVLNRRLAREDSAYLYALEKKNIGPVDHRADIPRRKAAMYWAGRWPTKARRCPGRRTAHPGSAGDPSSPGSAPGCWGRPPGSPR